MWIKLITLIVLTKLIVNLNKIKASIINIMQDATKIKDKITELKKLYNHVFDLTIHENDLNDVFQHFDRISDIKYDGKNLVSYSDTDFVNDVQKILVESMETSEEYRNSLLTYLNVFKPKLKHLLISSIKRPEASNYNGQNTLNIDDEFNRLLRSRGKAVIKQIIAKSKMRQITSSIDKVELDYSVHRTKIMNYKEYSDKPYNKLTKIAITLIDSKYTDENADNLKARLLMIGRSIRQIHDSTFTDTKKISNQESDKNYLICFVSDGYIDQIINKLIDDRKLHIHNETVSDKYLRWNLECIADLLKLIGRASAIEMVVDMLKSRMKQLDVDNTYTNLLIELVPDNVSFQFGSRAIDKSFSNIDTEIQDVSDVFDPLIVQVMDYLRVDNTNRLSNKQKDELFDNWVTLYDISPHVLDSVPLSEHILRLVRSIIGIDEKVKTEALITSYIIRINLKDFPSNEDVLMLCNTHIDNIPKDFKSLRPYIGVLKLINYDMLLKNVNLDQDLNLLLDDEQVETLVEILNENKVEIPDLKNIVNRLYKFKNPTKSPYNIVNNLELVENIKSIQISTNQLKEIMEQPDEYIKSYYDHTLTIPNLLNPKDFDKNTIIQQGDDLKDSKNEQPRSFNMAKGESPKLSGNSDEDYEEEPEDPNLTISGLNVNVNHEQPTDTKLINQDNLLDPNRKKILNEYDPSLAFSTNELSRDIGSKIVENIQTLNSPLENPNTIVTNVKQKSGPDTNSMLHHISVKDSSPSIKVIPHVNMKIEDIKNIIIETYGSLTDSQKKALEGPGDVKLEILELEKKLRNGKTIKYVYVVYHDDREFCD